MSDRDIRLDKAEMDRIFAANSGDRNGLIWDQLGVTPVDRLNGAVRIAEFWRDYAHQLRCLAADAIWIARHGDYKNGVTDPNGMIDEGEAKAGEFLGELEDRATKLRVIIHSTSDENHRFYQE